MQNQLTFYRGDTVNINITVKADLTGSTLFFTMKTAPDNDLSDTSAIIQSTVTSHTDPVNGKSFSLAKAITSGAMRSEIWYLVNPTGGSGGMSPGQFFAVL